MSSIIPSGVSSRLLYASLSISFMHFFVLFYLSMMHYFSRPSVTQKVPTMIMLANHFLYVAMFLPRYLGSAGQNAEDVKVGPSGFQLPLPWLIPICIFSPFFLGLIIFVIHRYTFVRRRHAKQAALGAHAKSPKLSADVETEIQVFLPKPAQISCIEIHTPLEVKFT